MRYKMKVFDIPVLTATPASTPSHKLDTIAAVLAGYFQMTTGFLTIKEHI